MNVSIQAELATGVLAICHTIVVHLHCTYTTQYIQNYTTYSIVYLLFNSGEHSLGHN